MSKIEWTEKTWNPTIGCTEVSPGCTNCYAAKMAWRLAHIPAMQQDYWGLTKKLENGRIVWTGEVRELPDRLNEPLLVKKSTVWFVDSMSDLFHKDVSWNFIYKVFEMMLLTPRHTYQVLTKRADRLSILSDIYLHLQRNYPDTELPLKNVQLGVSIENQKAADERIPKLLQAPAAVRFLSCEPLLGDVFITHYLLKGINWVICGGESGHGARPMHPDWARSLRDQCQAAGVSFFFKQWGNWHPYTGEQMEDLFGPDYSEKPCRIVEQGKDKIYMYNVGKKAAGRILDGRTHDDYPP